MQHERLHLQSGLDFGPAQPAAMLKARASHRIGPLLVRDIISAEGSNSVQAWCMTDMLSSMCRSADACLPRVLAARQTGGLLRAQVWVVVDGVPSDVTFRSECT